MIDVKKSKDGYVMTLIGCRGRLSNKGFWS